MATVIMGNKIIWNTIEFHLSNFDLLKAVERKIMKLLNLAFLIVFLFCYIFCHESESLPVEFKDDINKVRHFDFKFNPNNMPEVGITTEKNLYQMYPEGPSLRSTFLKKRLKKINNTIFSYDHVFQYAYEEREILKTPRVVSYRGLESITLVVFTYKEVVTYFIISHQIKDKDDKWVPGKYNQLDTKIENWTSISYPGSAIDGCLYWLQWPMEKRYKYIGNAVDGFTEEDCQNGVTQSDKK